MKTNFHTHILSILILIGFIPKSKLQMIIVGIVSYLIAFVAVANHFIRVYLNPIDFDIFDFFAANYKHFFIFKKYKINFFFVCPNLAIIVTYDFYFNIYIFLIQCSGKNIIWSLNEKTNVILRHLSDSFIEEFSEIMTFILILLQI